MTVTEARVEDRSLVIDRVLPAPRDAVWAAWTDPRRLPKWWGPREFTCETREIDLREGGQWRFDMIGPEGTRYPNRHRFRRIAPKHAIHYTLDDDGTGAHHFEAEVRFADAEGGTRVTLKMIFPTAEERDAVEAFGAVAYGHTTFDCLTEAAAPGTLSVTRILNASQKRVWRCWTNAEEMAHWFFPDGIDIKSADFLPRTGQPWRTVMRSRADGREMVVRGQFVSVDPEESLVFTHGWEDDTGVVATETTVTITLHEEAGRTRLTLAQAGLATAESLAGHREGWSQTLDNLAAYLVGEAKVAPAPFARRQRSEQ